MCLCVEREVLAGLVEGVVWFVPTQSELHLYGDGGVAIIDQWIAARAMFFIGIASQKRVDHVASSKDSEIFSFIGGLQFI